MTEITIPPDQPDASFGTFGSRYFGVYRLPFGRWRQLLGKDKERLYFATSQEATRAAMAKVNSILFRPITADTTKAEDATAKALAADVVAFKQRREREHREMRKIFRGAGKGFVPVEVVKRRGA